MNENEKKLFYKLRKQVADYICKDCEENGGHTYYTGDWQIFVSCSNYFENKTEIPEPDFYKISLRCYTLCPGMYGDWYGKSFMEALEKCECDINEWVKED